MASTGTVCSAARIKRTGAHYTPPELAKYLASQVISHVATSPLKILDPACGDGELLLQAFLSLPVELRGQSTLYGMEQSSEALQQAERRLYSCPGAPRFELQHCDFLSWSRSFNQPEIFTTNAWPNLFDAVIANPPYVRTQVLGARTARRLAGQFSLKGRVDLYHAFAFAMTSVLREGGILGLLCSNRFLSIQSGVTLRTMLLECFELHDIVDLGDTKLFEAAVLPAIVIGTKISSKREQHSRFTRIYERRSKVTVPVRKFSSVAEALNSGHEGIVRVTGCDYELERGMLANAANSTEPWRLSAPAQELWLANVRAKAPYTFADLVNVRVGIKTTADKVFIREDWQDLPHELRPEDQLLYPLVSNDDAAPWWKLSSHRQRRVLYTHTVEHGKRVPINLHKFPRAARYLESHRVQLERRRYVTGAGRKWFEIWVPQQPGEWSKPKVVFPDISSTPKFFLDETGSIVDGNSYWFAASDTDHLYLLMAIANSTFIVRFYDTVCGNKLYAGRRRFITQYVQRFPVLDPYADAAKRIVEKAKEVYEFKPFEPGATRKIQELDDLVNKAFC